MSASADEPTASSGPVSDMEMELEDVSNDPTGNNMFFLSNNGKFIHL